MSLCVDQGSLETDARADTHSEEPHLSSRYSQLEILSPVEGRVLGEGPVFVANGSWRVGGPLPALCEHTCDISH